MISRSWRRWRAAPSEANDRLRDVQSVSPRRRRWSILAVAASSVAAMTFTGGNPVQAGAQLCYPTCYTTTTAPPVSQNWARGAPSSSVGVPCTVDSTWHKALDGAASNIYTDKWCEVSGQRRLLIEMPELNLNTDGYAHCGVDIQKIVIKHAGVAENPVYNTRSFRVRTLSQYTGVWSDYKTVTGNTANISQIDPSNAPNLAYSHVKYVELTIDAATQSSSQVVRIYEVEVWATASVYATQFLCPGVQVVIP